MTVLAATDFSETAGTAVEAAARLAMAGDTSLTLLHCLDELADDAGWRQDVTRQMRAEYRKGAMDRMQQLFEEAVSEQERPPGVDYRVDFHHAGEGITEVLESGDFELGVIGATGRNRVANFFLGSTPEEVVRRSDTPILVVPGEADLPPYDKIVAPVDFTDCSRKSLERAAGLARDHGAELVIVHAYNIPSAAEASPIPSSAPSETLEALKKQRRRRYDDLIEETDLEGIEWEGHRRLGSPHDVIVEAVEETGADLVVMGTHGRRGFERFFLGSTATKVLRRMPCSIMTLRTREGEQMDERDANREQDT